MTDFAIRIAQPANFLVLPVLAWQGRRLRATTPRLPEATGTSGVASGDRRRPLKIGVLGESTAAGVGADRHEAALAGHLGAALATKTGREVSWRVVARTGATAQVVRKDLVPRLVAMGWRPDLVVLLVGVNDLMRYRRLRSWEREARLLGKAIRESLGPMPVLVAGMPPIHRFPSLPRPLRTVLSLRARAMDGGLRRVTTEMSGIRFVPTPSETTAVAGFFGVDRFHPSSEGYRHWAGLLSGPAVEAVGTGNEEEPLWTSR